MSSESARPARGRRIWLPRLCILVTVVALGFPVAWLYGKAIPSDIHASRESVRLRNSLIASVGSPADFDWTPANVPAGFRWERGPAPQEFVDVTAKLLAAADGQSNFDKMLILARHLRSRPTNDSPVGVSTVEAYHKIVDEGVGWCSDFTQVLNGLSFAAGLPVREWGFSFDGFGGLGHAITEVWDEELRKWVFLDSYYSFYLRDIATKAPFSVQDLRAFLKSGKPHDAVEIVPIVPERIGFQSPEKLVAYYRDGADQFYLHWGNDVFALDANATVQSLRRVSPALSQVTAIVLGIYPEIRISPDDARLPPAESLFALRDRFFAVLAAIVVLSLALIAAIVWHHRARRPR